MWCVFNVNVLPYRWSLVGSDPGRESGGERKTAPGSARFFPAGTQKKQLCLVPELSLLSGFSVKKNTVLSTSFVRNQKKKILKLNLCFTLIAPWLRHTWWLLPLYLCVAVAQRHQGGVDDLSVHVWRLAFPVPDWLLGVDPVVQLISAPAPQHHLETKTGISPHVHVNRCQEKCWIYPFLLLFFPKHFQVISSLEVAYCVFYFFTLVPFFWWLSCGNIYIWRHSWWSVESCIAQHIGNFLRI